MSLYDWKMRFYHEIYALRGVDGVETDYDEYTEVLTINVSVESHYDSASDEEIRSVYYRITRDCPYTTRINISRY